MLYRSNTRYADLVTMETTWIKIHFCQQTQTKDLGGINL